MDEGWENQRVRANEIACIYNAEARAQTCTHAYVKKIVASREHAGINSTRACSTFVADATPPSDCGVCRVLPKGKKLHPEIFL